MSLLASKVIAKLLLPPANLLIIGILGALIARRSRRLGFALVALAVLSLYLLSIPAVANRLLMSLESATRVDLSKSAQAIVILGGGVYANTPEYGGETISAFTLERLRYGALLHRQTKLPILVTGGLLMPGQRRSEAALMQQSLHEDFNLPAQWVEDQAHTTEENAVLSARMLEPLGIQRVYLVSHAWHMRRAARAFAVAGLTPIPAPTGFTTSFRGDIRDFIPDAKALNKSYYATHEAIGLLWYRFKKPFKTSMTVPATTQ